MNDETLKLIEAATYLAFFFIGLAITIWVKPWLDAKVGVEHSTLIFNWAQTLVRAAEQMMAPGTGFDKYTYVRGALEALADSKNIKLTNDALEAAIESAVHQLKSEQTSAPAAAAIGNVVVAAPAATIEATEKEGAL